jgi:hypothetical protein
MTAIITPSLKYQLIKTLFDENVGEALGDSDNYYYIAVGRSQQWQPDDNTDVTPTPATTEREEREFRYNMQSVKLTEAFQYVVPLYDWSANTIYSAYNDNVSGQPAQSYYVKTEDNNVYLCIRSGKNATGTVQVSTVKPDHTNTTLPTETDGYIWKYLYTISTSDANNFLTSQFMPVKFVDSDEAVADPTLIAQRNVITSAVPGQIVGYRIKETGGVYSSAPSISIVGNGSNATARAILGSTGNIAAIEVGDSAGADILTSMGSGYDYANVVVSDANLTSGSNAKVAPIFADTAGLGADPRVDLRSTSLMFNIKPEGTVEDTWVVDQGYRQLGLIKNPTIYDDSATFTTAQGIALNRMTITTAPGDGNAANGYAISFDGDKKIEQASSGAVAWLDYYDDSSTLWYHQDEVTGFTPFTDGNTITVTDYSGGTLTVDTALVNPDIDKFSGELLFVNNTNEVGRETIGSEDIKIVIKL